MKKKDVFSDIESKFDELIAQDCSPGWSGYVSEEDFEKEKLEFLHKLKSLFPKKTLKELYAAMTSNITRLDSGDLKCCLLGSNKAEIKEYPKIVFDKNIQSGEMIILFSGPDNVDTINKAEKAAQQHIKNSKEDDNIIWGVFKSGKERMSSILLEKS
jgi:hypothetical protein